MTRMTRYGASALALEALDGPAMVRNGADDGLAGDVRQKGR